MSFSFLPRTAALPKPNVPSFPVKYPAPASLSILMIIGFHVSRVTKDGWFMSDLQSIVRHPNLRWCMLVYRNALLSCSSSSLTYSILVRMFMLARAYTSKQTIFTFKKPQLARESIRSSLPSFPVSSSSSFSSFSHMSSSHRSFSV